MAKNDIQVTLSLLDRFSKPFDDFNRRVEAMQAPLRTVSNRISLLGRSAGIDRLAQQFGRVRGAAAGVAGELGKIGGMLGLAGGGALFAFKKGFVDVAAEFERFETVLGTIEGSPEAAKKAMDWISDFATKTPYELTEVTEAFVKLRAYGMDPTQGLLMSLGDTSAAMGKPLMQAVEAIADAVTGENERLKEFGIRASKVGEKIVYEYTHNGKTIRAAAQAGNRAQIQATLEAIWNEKYSGAMDKLSGTWGGTIAKIGDHWAQFANMVMKSGPFELLKERVNGLLSEIDAMAEDGRLQAIAEDWGRKITYAFERTYEVGMRLYRFFNSFVDTVGGLENALMILAGVAAGPLILSLLTLAQTIGALGIALLTTPVGWFIGALALIAGAAYVIYRNWEPLKKWLETLWNDPLAALDQAWEWYKETFSWTPLALIANNWGTLTGFFRGLWDDIGKIFTDAIAKIESFITGLWDRVGGMFSEGAEKVKQSLSSLNPMNAAEGAWNWAKGLFSGEEDPLEGSVMKGYGEPVGALPVASEAAQVQQQLSQTTTNNARVEVDFKNVPRGVEVTPAANNRAPLDLSMGYAMQTP